MTSIQNSFQAGKNELNSGQWGVGPKSNLPIIANGWHEQQKLHVFLLQESVYLKVGDKM